MVFLDYNNNNNNNNNNNQNSGSVSLFSITGDNPSIYKTWSLSYHPNNETHIFNQMNGFIISNTSVNNQQQQQISFLICVDSVSLYIDTYSLLNGSQISSKRIVYDLPCTEVYNSKIGYIPNSNNIVIQFYLLDNSIVKSYVGIYTPSKSINWFLTSDKEKLLDFGISGESIYLCRENSILFINTTSLEQKKYSYSDSISTSLKQCLIAIGENSFLIQSKLNTNESVLLRGFDSLCPTLCNINSTCQLNGCQCLPKYYSTDSGSCNKYCDPVDTCSNHGECDDNGNCVCDPHRGYIGETCDTCKSGWFGDSCNMHLSYKAIIIGFVVGALATSSICIFCCLTMPKKEGKRRCAKCRTCFSSCTSKFKRSSNSDGGKNYSPILTSISTSASTSTSPTLLSKKSKTKDKKEYISLTNAVDDNDGDEDEDKL
eukprot:gene2418-2986_t